VSIAGMPLPDTAAEIGKGAFMRLLFRRGRFGDVSLDGLCFALAGVAPGPMGDGNWNVGLIVDDRADAAQEKAIAAIASGEAGGPLAALAPLIASFRGVEKKSIRFEKDGLRRSVSIPGMLDQAVEGVPSPTVPGEPLVIDNSIQPGQQARCVGARRQERDVRVRLADERHEWAQQRSLRGSAPAGISSPEGHAEATCCFGSP
jgi:hypothetical protein